MPETATIRYAGLDISKDRLDYSIATDCEGSFENSPDGQRQWMELVKAKGSPRVVCEASGGYEKLVVAKMLEVCIEVCLVQPGRVRAYANAEGLLAKTDLIDARLLRRFGQAIQPRLSVPVDGKAQMLRELLEHRRQLVERISELSSRMETAGKTLYPLIQRERTFLNKECEKVDRMIEEHIDNDPGLRSKAQRLRALKGVGPVLAATILAYVPEIGSIGDRSLAALIGVAPHPKDSGKTRGPRHVRGGRSQVRRVLYMAAVAACRLNPILASFYQRLVANGKPKMIGIVAVMRKMLCVMNRLIADPNFVLAQ